MYLDFVSEQWDRALSRLKSFVERGAPEMRSAPVLAEGFENCLLERPSPPVGLGQIDSTTSTLPTFRKTSTFTEAPSR